MPHECPQLGEYPNYSTDLIHSLKDLIGISEAICSARLYCKEKLAAPNTSSGIPDFPMLLYNFVIRVGHEHMQREVGETEN